MCGHDRKARYAKRQRLRMLQRKILLVLAGAWSAVFFFRPSNELALALNVLVLILLIAGVLIEIVVMRQC